MEAAVLQPPIFAEEPAKNVACAPGPEMAASLPTDLGGLSDEELLDVAAAARRVASWAQSRELDAIAELHRRRTRAEQDGDPDYRILSAHESVVQEVSAALAVTGNAAATLVDFADRLTTTLPETHQALQTGHIDSGKARVFSDLTGGLEPWLCEHIQARVLPAANRRTTGQLRRSIRDIIKRLAPEHLQQRKREAVADRRLSVWDDDHAGTCDLTLSGLDPTRAHAVYNKVTATARAMRADGDPRTLHQLRADLAEQLLHGHNLSNATHGLQTRGQDVETVPMSASLPAGLTAPLSTAPPSSKPAPSSQPAPSTAPLSTALSADQDMVSDNDMVSDAIAALLADTADRELGRIRDHLKTTGHARALPFRIARAARDIHNRLAGLRETWCQTHDAASGRSVYRPNTALRRAIEARHLTCAFPTCNQRSTRCDLDHTVPWGRGSSCQCNLAPLCRKHHRTKQSPGWTLLQPWPGLLLWITPSGSWHITLPTRE